jgi:uncharacterized membrane protein
VRGNLIPAMIFLMLLRCDLRKIMKLGPGCLSVLLGDHHDHDRVVVMFAFMKNGFPPEAWKDLGRARRSWSAGRRNMVAIQGRSDQRHPRWDTRFSSIT